MPHKPTVRGERTKRWYASFPDAQGRSRRVAAFNSKSATAALESMLRRIAEARRYRQPIDAECQAWLDDRCPDHVRRALVKAHLVEPARAAAGRSLTAHLDAFESHLEARGNSPRYIRETRQRLKCVFEDCGFLTPADLDIGPVRRFLGRLRSAGRAAATITAYTTRLRQFGAWLEREGVVSTDPLRHLERPRGGKPGQAKRRAATEKEITRLLNATARAPQRHGMSGPERALLYRLTIESGLRRNEVITLERRALNLESTPPTVWVQGRYAKNRREAYLPLRTETAALLREHVSTMLPGARVFTLPRNARTAEMLREDLDAAKIDGETEDGVLDFHALRHTMISRLARSGVHPKTAQELARHSTITLTMDVYSHVSRDEQVRAIESLPKLGGAG